MYTVDDLLEFVEHCKQEGIEVTMMNFEKYKEDK